MLLRTITGALLVSSCTRPPAAQGAAAPNADPLHVAVQQLTSVIVHDIFSPPQASRVYALAGRSDQ
jgi:hypothetical protein